jgi:hypothetical protein
VFDDDDEEEEEMIVRGRQGLARAAKANVVYNDDIDLDGVCAFSFQLVPPRDNRCQKDQSSRGSLEFGPNSF